MDIVDPAGQITAITLGHQKITVHLSSFAIRIEESMLVNPLSFSRETSALRLKSGNIVPNSIIRGNANIR